MMNNDAILDVDKTLVICKKVLNINEQMDMLCENKLIKYRNDNNSSWVATAGCYDDPVGDFGDYEDKSEIRGITHLLTISEYSENYWYENYDILNTKSTDVITIFLNDYKYSRGYFEIKDENMVNFIQTYESDYL